MPASCSRTYHQADQKVTSEMGSLGKTTKGVTLSLRESLGNSSARTRLYQRLPKKDTINSPVSLQGNEEVAIIKENIKKSKSFKKKCVWVSHDTDLPVALSSSPTSADGNQTSSDKSSQESAEVGVGDDNVLISTSPVTTDQTKVPPSYLLVIPPNSVPNTRRDLTMKRKLGQLEEENKHLKRMLLMAMSKDNCQGPEKKAPVTPTVFTVAPSISGPAPTKGSRRTSVPSQPKHSRRNGRKSLDLEKEKELIRNLYKQFDDDDDEDMESILAAIKRTSIDTTSTSSSPWSMGSSDDDGDDSDDYGKKNVRKHMIILETGSCDDDEVQIIKEISLKLVKV